MRPKRRTLLLVSASLLVAIALLCLATPLIQRAIFYPLPTHLPPIVEESTADLLAKLEVTLEANAPNTLASLQPGLSDAQITTLESKLGFPLTEDLRALYRWRNGMPAADAARAAPYHRFLPLDEAVEKHLANGQIPDAETAAGQLLYNVQCAHTRQWIQIVDDGTGDGYHYDPNRTDPEGAFFEYFPDWGAGSYTWFPSFRNYLAGLIKGYELGYINDLYITDESIPTNPFDIPDNDPYFESLIYMGQVWVELAEEGEALE